MSIETTNGYAYKIETVTVKTALVYVRPLTDGVKKGVFIGAIYTYIDCGEPSTCHKCEHPGEDHKYLRCNGCKNGLELPLKQQQYEDMIRRGQLQVIEGAIDPNRRVTGRKQKRGK